MGISRMLRVSPRRQSLFLSRSYPFPPATITVEGRFLIKSRFLITRSRRVLRPVITPVTTLLVPNTLTNVGAARPLKLEAPPLRLPTATWYALAIAPSIAVDRTVSTSTITLALSPTHLLPGSPQSQICQETGPSMDAGCKPPPPPTFSSLMPVQ